MFEYTEYSLGNYFHRLVAINKTNRQLIYEITYKAGITLRWEGEIINYKEV